MMLERIYLTANSVVHLDVEDISEELLRQLSYEIKNQLKVSKIVCLSLVLYSIKAPMMGPFRAWKPPILMP